MRERTIAITAFRVFALYCLYQSLCGGLNNLVTAVSTWVMGRSTNIQTKFLLSSGAAPLTGACPLPVIADLPSAGT